MVNGDVYEVKAYCYAAARAQLGVNVFHYLASGVVGAGATDTEVADGIATLVALAYKNQMGTDATFYGVGAQKIIPGPKSAGGVSANGRGSGLDAGTLLPSQVSGIVTWRTAFAGRGFRGRTYFPFPARNEEVTNETPDPAYGIKIATTAALIQSNPTIVGAGGSGTLTLGILHRATSTMTAITSLTPRLKWATQRRRGDYGRVNVLPF